MAFRNRQEDHENQDRWLVSYADFITLLFAFFVVMYSISSLNEGKYRIASDSIVQAFKNAPTSEKKIYIPAPLPQYAESGKIVLRPIPIRMTDKMPPNLQERVINKDSVLRHESMKSVTSDLLKVMEPLVKEGQVKVTESNRGISIEIKASLLFDIASASLHKETIEVLQAVAKVLASDNHQIQIEGHTDNQPINSPIFPSNWELSSARASSVIRLFAENGVAPSRMVAIGFADQRPVESNDAIEGRARNRRVKVMILAEKQGQVLDGGLDPDIKPVPTTSQVPTQLPTTATSVR